MAKTFDCIGCGMLVDEPGAVVCARCRIHYPPPPKKYKILLVDDDLNLLKDLKKKLEATLFFDVATAYDGMKGFEKISYEKPDMIISDFLMPRMNGQELVAKIRLAQSPSVKKLPVIILSDNKKMEKFFQLGDIHGYFVKPIDLKELFAKMKEVLNISEMGKK